MDLQLQRIRKQAGLDQQKMADALSIKKRTYGAWERGETMMNLEQAFQVTQILGCTLEELVGREREITYLDERQKTLNEAFMRLPEQQKDSAVFVVEGLEKAACAQDEEVRTKGYKVS